MTDDISMGALSGGFRDRAEAAIGAGCDLVLHCNGEMSEMAEVAAGVPELVGESLRRTERALAARQPAGPVDRPAIEARLDFLLAKIAGA
jgi:beta-N-acetylhexosaminidase